MDNPIKTVVIAAGAGAIIASAGWVLGRVGMAIINRASRKAEK